MELPDHVVNPRVSRRTALKGAAAASATVGGFAALVGGRSPARAVAPTAGQAASSGSLAVPALGVNVRDPKYNAQGDVQAIGDASMTSGGQVLASPSSHFLTTAAVGQLVSVTGVGPAGAPMSGTVSSIIDDTHMAVTLTAATTASGQWAAYGTNDSAAFVSAQRDLPRGGIVFVPAGSYFCNVVIMDGIGLAGAGKLATKLCALPGSSTDVITLTQALGSFSPNQWSIRDLTVEGFAGFGCTGRGAYLSTNNEVGISGASAFDGLNDMNAGMSDVVIKNPGGTGLFVGKNVRESHFRDVFISNAGGNGFDVQCNDSFFTNCSSGVARMNGFNVPGNAVSFTGCKSWYSGRDNWYIPGGQNHLSNCEGQDNNNGSSGADLRVYGSDNLVSNFRCDGGKGHALYIGGAAVFNRIDATIGHADLGTYIAALTLDAYNIGAQPAQNRIHIQAELNGNAFNFAGGAHFFNPINGAVMGTNLLQLQNEFWGITYVKAGPYSLYPWDGRTKVVSLGAAPTSILPASTECYPGQEVVFVFQQDSTGGRTVTWDSHYQVGAFLVGPAPNSVSSIHLVNIATTRGPGTWVPISTTTGS
jgi:hypothetical protein